MDKPGEAIQAFANAEKFYRSSSEKQPRLWVNIQINRAESFFKLNELDKTEKTYKSALKDFENIFKDKGFTIQGRQGSEICIGWHETF